MNFQECTSLVVSLEIEDIKYHLCKCSELSSENTAQGCLESFVVTLYNLRTSVWDILSCLLHRFNLIQWFNKLLCA